MLSSWGFLETRIELSRTEHLLFLKSPKLPSPKADHQAASTSLPEYEGQTGQSRTGQTSIFWTRCCLLRWARPFANEPCNPETQGTKKKTNGLEGHPSQVTAVGPWMLKLWRERERERERERKERERFHGDYSDNCLHRELAGGVQQLAQPSAS